MFGIVVFIVIILFLVEKLLKIFKFDSFVSNKSTILLRITFFNLSNLLAPLIVSLSNIILFRLVVPSIVILYPFIERSCSLFKTPLDKYLLIFLKDITLKLKSLI
ncbi:MAG: hypothetical protein ACRC4S_02505 [Cetobacterium sp.]